MKKLHSFAFYALVTPVLALGTGSVLAQQLPSQNSTPTSQDATHSSQQRDQNEDATQYTTTTTQSDQDTRNQSRTQNRGYMSSAPDHGMQASNLIGATVRTSGNEDVGSVSDLLIDEDGQIVGIVIGVGGFLGIGERDVAIGWDDVTRSGAADEQELRIEKTRDDLRSAPAFATLD